MPGGPRANRALPQIDGLRALAVCEVVAFHAATRVIPTGFIGVDIFLVLSGFLITSILVREYERTSTVVLSRFYARRALRILPALAVVAVVMIAAASVWHGLRSRDQTLAGAVAALTYTSSPLAAAGHDLGDFLPTWSLSVQEYFYVAWPIVMLLLLRRRRRVAVVTVLALTAAGAAYTVAAFALFHWSEERISYAPDTRLVQLLIGVLLALLVSRGRIAVPSWVAVGSTVLLLGAIALPLRLSEAVYYSGGNLVVALLAGLVVVHLAGGGSRVARLLSWAPLVWVGRRSYGIYLWSLPVAALVNLVPLATAPRLVTKVALILLVPGMSYRFLEEPMLRLRRHFDRPRAVSLAAAPSPTSDQGLSVTLGPTGSRDAAYQDGPAYKEARSA